MSNEQLQEQHSNGYLVYVVFPNGIESYHLGRIITGELQISFDSMVRLQDSRGLADFWVEKWRLYPTKQLAQEKFNELYGGENYVEYDAPIEFTTPSFITKKLKK